MNEVTEKDRHHETDWCPVSVHGPSQSGEKGFAPESTRKAQPATLRRERRLWPAQQPTGGSESGERSEPVLPRPVGPGRGTNDRMEGGPTGTTDLLCGGGRGRGGGGAYRTLPYAAAMVNGAESSGYSQSIPEMGGSM